MSVRARHTTTSAVARPCSLKVEMTRCTVVYQSAVFAGKEEVHSVSTSQSRLGARVFLFLMLRPPAPSSTLHLSITRPRGGATCRHLPHSTVSCLPLVRTAPGATASWRGAATTAPAPPAPPQATRAAWCHVTSDLGGGAARASIPAVAHV